MSDPRTAIGMQSAPGQATCLRKIVLPLHRILSRRWAAPTEPSACSKPGRTHRRPGDVQPGGVQGFAGRNTYPGRALAAIL